MAKIDQEAERGALCCMMIRPKVVIPEAMAKLRSEWFFEPASRIIFDTLLELFESKKYAGDYRVLCNVLRNNNLLEECGGDEEIRAIFNFADWISFDYYCDAVRKAYLIRQSQQLSTALSEADSESALRCINDQLGAILEQMMLVEEVPTTEIIHSWRDYLNELNVNSAADKGIMSGIQCVDDHTCGFQPQDLVIVTAESSHGKTALGLQIVNHALFNQAFAVTVCSFEMNCKRLLNRMTANRKEISMESFKRGRFTPEGIKGLNDYTEALLRLAASNKLWFYEKRSTSIDSVVSVIRSHRDKYGIQLAVVDYLQLIEAMSKRRNSTQAEEIGLVSTKLKGLAEELDIVIVAMAQLNDDRKVRGSRQPFMDCDVNIEIVPDGPTDQDERDIILHIKKGRNIGEKAFKLMFDRLTQRFCRRIIQVTEDAQPNGNHDRGTETINRRMRSSD